jgi:hypothetical protein
MMTLMRGKSIYQFAHMAFFGVSVIRGNVAANFPNWQETFNWGLIAPAPTWLPCYHLAALNEIL